MKDISELKVKQIRIFAADRVPFLGLRTVIGQRSMAERFSWSEVGTNPVVGELIFNAGVFQPEEGRPIIIDSLQISDRRIVLNVAAETEQANVVYSALAELLTRLDNSERWKNAKPIVLVHETSCVATLEFEWTSLLATSLQDFAETLKRQLSTKMATADIVGIKCSLLFSFDAKDQTIRENSITLTNKDFTVEPRKNTPLSERRYYTASPTDSETHLELVRKLEETLVMMKS